MKESNRIENRDCGGGGGSGEDFTLLNLSPLDPTHNDEESSLISNDDDDEHFSLTNARGRNNRTPVQSRIPNLINSVTHNNNNHAGLKRKVRVKRRPKNGIRNGDGSHHEIKDGHKWNSPNTIIYTIILLIFNTCWLATVTWLIFSLRAQINFISDQNNLLEAHHSTEISDLRDYVDGELHKISSRLEEMDKGIVQIKNSQNLNNTNDEVKQLTQKYEDLIKNLATLGSKVKEISQEGVASNKNNAAKSPGNVVN